MRFLKRSFVLYCIISIRISQGAEKRTTMTQKREGQTQDIPNTNELIIAKLECPSSRATVNLTFYGYNNQRQVGSSRLSLNRCGIGYVTYVKSPQQNHWSFNLTFLGPKEEFGNVSIAVEKEKAYHVTVSSDERVFWTVCKQENLTCYLDVIYESFQSLLTQTHDSCNEPSITEDAIITAVSVVRVISLICISVYTCHLRQQLKRERNTRKPLDAVPVQDLSAPRQQMEQMQPTDNRRFSDFSKNIMYGWINPSNHEQSSHEVGMQQ